MGAAATGEALTAFARDAEVAAVDLRDVPALTDACRGVGQIIATANNDMVSVRRARRASISAYQNLCAAARNTGVRRLFHVSVPRRHTGCAGRFFRVKWYIEDAIRRSGVTYVMLRPSAFMEIWIDPGPRQGHSRKGGGDHLRRRPPQRRQLHRRGRCRRIRREDFWRVQKSSTRRIDAAVC